MNIIQKEGHIICYDEFKYLENEELKAFIDEKKYEEFFRILKEETIISLGGDGTLLYAIKELSHLNKAFLGINFGNKGFLLNESSFILGEEFIEKKFPLLEYELKSKEETQTFFAFNEIDIRAGNGRIITLEISLNSKNLLFLSGDGVIVSTPAGSTGYNISLGGPIIPHEIEAFVITPKAPYLPKGQSSILISQKNILKIRNIGRKNTLQIYSDSILIYEGTGESVNIEAKKSNREVRLLIFKEYINYWEQKILIEQGFSK